VQNITIARNQINARPAANAPEMDWISWIQLVSTIQRQIDGTINRIEIQIQRWNNFMQKLDDSKIAKEQNIFNRNANGNEGFLATIKKGQEMSALLTSNIQFYKNFLEIQLCGPIFGTTFAHISTRTMNSMILTNSIICLAVSMEAQNN
jgi:hypothetical protein